MVITASLTVLCAKEQGGFIGGHADLPGKGNEKDFVSGLRWVGMRT